MKIHNGTEHVVYLQKEDTLLELGIGETRELTGEEAKGLWTAHFFTGTKPKTETSMHVEKHRHGGRHSTTLNIDRTTHYSAITSFECDGTGDIRLVQKNTNVVSILLPGISVRSIDAYEKGMCITTDTALPQKELHAIKRLAIFKIAAALLFFLMLLAMTLECTFGVFGLFGPETFFAPMAFVFTAIAGVVSFIHLKSFLKIKELKEPGV
jgi:hypothetical protein